MSVAKLVSVVGVGLVRRAARTPSVAVGAGRWWAGGLLRVPCLAYSTKSGRVTKVSDVSGQVYTTCEEVDYDDVVQGLQAEQSHLYIDVRETDEVQESGQIPSSKTIPLSEISDAFQLTESEFMTQYGFSKPAKDTRIVLYCRSGRRSKSACKILTDGGYGNVKNYTGSWQEWSARSPKK